MQTNIYVSWSTSELRVRLVPLNRLKPSRQIFYWPFQGGTSFVDLLCVFLSCVCYVFVRVCLYVLCGHLLGKGWPLGSRLWCLTVSLLLSYWYPSFISLFDKQCNPRSNSPTVWSGITLVVSKITIVNKDNDNEPVQRCGMCDQQSLGSACAYAQSDQSLC